MDENCDGQIDEGGIPTTADSDNNCGVGTKIPGA